MPIEIDFILFSELSVTSVMTVNIVLYYIQISLCFQKIAAEVLGIRLTKNEMEQQSVSFKNCCANVLCPLNTYEDW